MRSLFPDRQLYKIKFCNLWELCMCKVKISDMTFTIGTAFKKRVSIACGEGIQ